MHCDRDLIDGYSPCVIDRLLRACVLATSCLESSQSFARLGSGLPPKRGLWGSTPDNHTGDTVKYEAVSSKWCRCN